MEAAGIEPAAWHSQRGPGGVRRLLAPLFKVPERKRRWRINRWKPPWVGRSALRYKLPDMWTVLLPLLIVGQESQPPAAHPLGERPGQSCTSRGCAACPPAWLTARTAPVSGPPRHLRSSPHPQHGLYPAYTRAVSHRPRFRGSHRRRVAPLTRRSSRGPTGLPRTTPRGATGPPLPAGYFARSPFSSTVSSTRSPTLMTSYWGWSFGNGGFSP